MEISRRTFVGCVTALFGGMSSWFRPAKAAAPMTIAETAVIRNSTLSSPLGLFTIDTIEGPENVMMDLAKRLGTADKAYPITKLESGQYLARGLGGFADSVLTGSEVDRRRDFGPDAMSKNAMTPAECTKAFDSGRGMRLGQSWKKTGQRTWSYVQTDPAYEPPERINGKYKASMKDVREACGSN